MNRRRQVAERRRRGSPADRRNRGRHGRRRLTGRREPARGQRSARHLHAVGPARAVRGGDDRPRRRPQARRRHRFGLRRARDLRPLPGRAERRASSPKHGITSAPDHLTPFGSIEAAYRDSKGLDHGPPARLRGPPPRRRRDRRPAREPGLPPGRPEGPRRPRLPPRSGRPAPLRRGRAAAARLPVRRPVPPPGGARRASGTSTTSRRISASIRALQPALEAGKYAVTVAVHDGRTITGVWPGLHDRALRRRDRRRLDDDRRATWPISTTGEVLASAGVMNPQIRFGEDLMSRVSYAMMNEGGAAR